MIDKTRFTCKSCQMDVQLADSISERSKLLLIEKGICGRAECYSGMFDREEIHQYCFKPTPFFRSSCDCVDFKHKPSDDLFMGIELEVDSRDALPNDDGDSCITYTTSKATMVRRICRISTPLWLYFKKDSSVPNGFEIVSHPATLDAWNEYRKEFALVSELLCENHYCSWDSKYTGLHIHICLEKFGTWHLYRFLRFFSANKKFIGTLSGRDAVDLDKWASLVKDGSRYSMKKKAEEKKCKNRRVAVNIAEKTVEVRVFKGTLNIRRIYANMQFVHALFNFSLQYKRMSAALFKAYVKKNEDVYPDLIWLIHKC